MSNNDTVPAHLYKKMIEDRDRWKDAWAKQHHSTGTAWSDGYYRGLLLGLRQSNVWTIEMYQIASRVAAHLSFIRKTEGPGLSKLYSDRPVVPQLKPECKADVLKQISKLLK